MRGTTNPTADSSVLHIWVVVFGPDIEGRECERRRINSDSVVIASPMSQPNPQLPADWVAGEFTSTVQERGAAVIAARGLSSAMSAANAVGFAL